MEEVYNKIEKSRKAAEAINPNSTEAAFLKEMERSHVNDIKKDMLEKLEKDYYFSLAFLQKIPDKIKEELRCDEELQNKMNRSLVRELKEIDRDGRNLNIFDYWGFEQSLYKDSLFIPNEEVLRSAEVQEAAIRILMRELDNDETLLSTDIIRRFNIPFDALLKEEIQDTVKNSLKRRIATHQHADFMTSQFAEYFPGVIESEEIKKALEERFGPEEGKRILENWQKLAGRQY